MGDEPFHVGCDFFLQWIVVDMNGIVVNDNGVHMGRIALEMMSCLE